jgi:hypothetical protein
MDGFIPECLTKDVKRLKDYINDKENELKTYKIELCEYGEEASHTLFNDFIHLRDKYTFSSVSENSDIVTLRLKSNSFLGFIESTKNVGIIRYWKEAERYFIIRILGDDKKTLVKYIKIMIIFPSGDSRNGQSSIRVIVRVNKKNLKNGPSFTVTQVIEVILSYLKSKLADFIVFYKRPGNLRKGLIDLNREQLKGFNQLKEMIENRLGYEVFTNDELIRAILFTNCNLDKAMTLLFEIRKIYNRYYKKGGGIEPIMEFLGSDKNDNPLLALHTKYLRENTIIDKTINTIIKRVEDAVACGKNTIGVIVDFRDFLVDAIKLLNDIVILIKTLAYSIEVVYYIKNYDEKVLKHFVEKGVLISNNSINIYSATIPKEFLI